MTTRFVTCHVIVTLPLHNLNRDSNGLPKSQFDGGVQRARLSSQSLKRAARQAYRQAGHEDSTRTRLAAFEITRRVLDQADADGTQVDVDAVIKTAVTAVRALYTEKTDAKALAKQTAKVRDLLKRTQGRSLEEAVATAAAETAEETTEDKGAKKEQEAETKDTIVYLSTSEIVAFAAAVHAAHTGRGEEPTELVRSARSDALDIAAFGRMFAAQAGLATHAAVAVSHATTVHRMQLVTDYFTAVEDLETGHAGAAHIDESYFTSGTYYRTFTIDVDQLAASWTAFGEPGAKEALKDLVRALVLALPKGKVNATNSGTLPALVLAEVQNFRVTYDFEQALATRDDRGGYTAQAVAELARRQKEARDFDPTLFGDSVVAGRVGDATFAETTTVPDLEALLDFVVEQVYAGR
ncbi:type I-E CRISPR-associated protein Cas7/Cse4/CasC [Arsenicicoccus dermatophilus]|uniref:type I-E CRISPR-associated protein Cas7/Cse4/CasC n=1 Tax=Arsenicicoccus dermatophilus TaxID=1076331 RepID=UPI001F4CD17C|nr:type I-E CRISPR-associated protein Cas7/Cse4/CasC [Arsenicicoccus dermatophilus]MCH8611570.1 type I-E CRISPR-associated protein Cas7/Cse4/CasC [Arsenicicoccus dermatophilus]